MSQIEVGSEQIVEDVSDILKAGLQAELNLICDAAKVKFRMAAPDKFTGYGLSPTFDPRDRYNAISVWVDSVAEAGTFLNEGAPVDEEVTVGIRWLVHDNNPDLLERKKQLGTRAITRLLRRRWRVDFKSAVYNVRFDPVDFRYSSLRMRGGSSRGLKGYDVDTGDNVDAVIIGLRCIQRVSAPICRC